jgi:hypothetical protein
MERLVDGSEQVAKPNRVRPRSSLILFRIRESSSFHYAAGIEVDSDLAASRGA